jgi:hypothetical protein
VYGSTEKPDTIFAQHTCIYLIPNELQIPTFNQSRDGNMINEVMFYLKWLFTQGPMDCLVTTQVQFKTADRGQYKFITYVLAIL